MNKLLIFLLLASHVSLGQLGSRSATGYYSVSVGDQDVQADVLSIQNPVNSSTYITGDKVLVNMATSVNPIDSIVLFRDGLFVETVTSIATSIDFFEETFGSHELVAKLYHSGGTVTSNTVTYTCDPPVVLPGTGFYVYTGDMAVDSTFQTWDSVSTYLTDIGVWSDNIIVFAQDSVIYDKVTIAGWSSAGYIFNLRGGGGTKSHINPNHGNKSLLIDGQGIENVLVSVSMNNVIIDSLCLYNADFGQTNNASLTTDNSLTNFMQRYVRIDQGDHGHRATNRITNISSINCESDNLTNLTYRWGTESDPTFTEDFDTRVPSMYDLTNVYIYGFKGTHKAVGATVDTGAGTLDYSAGIILKRMYGAHIINCDFDGGGSIGGSRNVRYDKNRMEVKDGNFFQIISSDSIVWSNSIITTKPLATTGTSIYYPRSSRYITTVHSSFIGRVNEKAAFYENCYFVTDLGNLYYGFGQTTYRFINPQVGNWTSSGNIYASTSTDIQDHLIEFDSLYLDNGDTVNATIDQSAAINLPEEQDTTWFYTNHSEVQKSRFVSSAQDSITFSGDTLTAGIGRNFIVSSVTGDYDLYDRSFRLRTYPTDIGAFDYDATVVQRQRDEGAYMNQFDTNAAAYPPVDTIGYTYDSIIAVMTARNITPPSPTIQTARANFFTALDTIGILAKANMLFVLSTNNRVAGLNWVDLDLADTAEIANVTYTDTGATASGAGPFFLTGWSPSVTENGKWKSDSAAIAVYTGDLVDDTDFLYGINSGTDIFVRINGASSLSRINTAVSNGFTAPAAGSETFFYFEQDATTNYVYIDNTLAATTSVNANTIPAGEFELFRAGAGLQPSRIFVIYAGQGLNAQQRSVMRTAIKKLINASL